MTKKLIKDSKQLAYPKLKFLFDVLLLIGVALLLLKLGILLLNKFTSLDLTLYGGSLLWNLGPLVLMIGAGIGSNVVKDKYKDE